MGIKISQLGTKSGKLASTDLIEISEVSGLTYTSKKITGANLIELSLDTSPQLGGNLDVDGFGIVSSANNPITITPDGTGDVHLNADSVRIGDNNADATIVTRGTGDLILTTHEGDANQGVVRLYDGANGNIELTPNGTGAVVINIPINTKTASYKIALTDNCKLVELNSGSAVNLTVPPNSSTPFPIGANVLVAQYGAGQVTFVADPGVTIRSNGGKLKTSAQYSVATLIKRDTDEWYLAGDITT